jgi:hypothetical protein
VHQDPRRPRGPSALAETISIGASLDSHSIEVLKLEVGRLADTYGLAIDKFKVVTVPHRSRRRRYTSGHTG